MGSSFIQVENLTRRFDVSKPLLNRLLQMEGRTLLTAVDEVSFELERGTTYALVGESGSGKSTIAKMLVGLLRPSGGSVRIDGTDIQLADAESLLEVRKRIQMIFQDPYASLNPRWRVRDIVGEPYRAFSKPTSEELDKKVGELLEKVGLSPTDASKFPHEFSGGQRQRICIARALSSEPEFIVCDEPTSALDVSVQAQVLNLMRDLQRDLGLTYLFITHDLAVVRYMADRVGVLYLGRLIESAPRETLFSSPRHPYTQMLLNAAPRLDGFDREHSTEGGEIPDPINPPRRVLFPSALSPCDGSVQKGVSGIEGYRGYRISLLPVTGADWWLGQFSGHFFASFFYVTPHSSTCEMIERSAGGMMAADR